MTIENINKIFVGRRVIEIKEVDDCDEGLILIFDDGSQLKYGYSGCEGATWIDGKLEAPGLSSWERNYQTKI